MAVRPPKRLPPALDEDSSVDYQLMPVGDSEENMSGLPSYRERSGSRAGLAGGRRASIAGSSRILPGAYAPTPYPARPALAGPKAPGGELGSTSADGSNKSPAKNGPADTGLVKAASAGSVKRAATGTGRELSPPPKGSNKMANMAKAAVGVFSRAVSDKEGPKETRGRATSPRVERAERATSPRPGPDRETVGQALRAAARSSESGRASGRTSAPGNTPGPQDNSSGTLTGRTEPTKSALGTSLGSSGGPRPASVPTTEVKTSPASSSRTTDKRGSDKRSSKHSDKASDRSSASERVSANRRHRASVSGPVGYSPVADTTPKRTFERARGTDSPPDPTNSDSVPSTNPGSKFSFRRASGPPAPVPEQLTALEIISPLSRVTPTKSPARPSSNPIPVPRDSTPTMTASHSSSSVASWAQPTIVTGEGVKLVMRRSANTPSAASPSGSSAGHSVVNSVVSSVASNTDSPSGMRRLSSAGLSVEAAMSPSIPMDKFTGNSEQSQFRPQPFAGWQGGDSPALRSDSPTIPRVSSFAPSEAPSFASTASLGTRSVASFASTGISFTSAGTPPATGDTHSVSSDSRSVSTTGQTPLPTPTSGAGMSDGGFVVWGPSRARNLGQLVTKNESTFMEPVQAKLYSYPEHYIVGATVALPYRQQIITVALLSHRLTHQLSVQQRSFNLAETETSPTTGDSPRDLFTFDDNNVFPLYLHGHNLAHIFCVRYLPLSNSMQVFFVVFDSASGDLLYSYEDATISQLFTPLLLPILHDLVVVTAASTSPARTASKRDSVNLPHGSSPLSSSPTETGMVASGSTSSVMSACSMPTGLTMHASNSSLALGMSARSFAGGLHRPGRPGDGSRPALMRAIPPEQRLTCLTRLRAKVSSYFAAGHGLLRASDSTIAGGHTATVSYRVTIHGVDQVTVITEPRLLVSTPRLTLHQASELVAGTERHVVYYNEKRLVLAATPRLRVVPTHLAVDSDGHTVINTDTTMYIISPQGTALGAINRTTHCPRTGAHPLSSLSAYDGIVVATTNPPGLMSGGNLEVYWT